MKGFQKLAKHSTKMIGLVILSVGVLVSIVYKIHPFVVAPKLSADKHLAACMWIMLLGMYLTAFSQEKFEDERVQTIRARALQMVMMLMSATFLAFSLTAITQDLGEFDVTLLLLFPLIYLSIYLAIFHMGLYFDFLWDYDDKKLSFLENLKKNKKPIIIFQAIAWAVLILIFLLLS